MPANFLERRTTVLANALSGPRVYSTDLLASHLNTNDVDGSVREAARALKIKILTKGTVVLNSTHFMDPLGVALCARHPDVLAGKALLPAFRVGDPTLKVPSNEKLPEYQAIGVSEEQLADHLQRLEKQIAQVMPWEIGDVGERLRQRLVGGLANDHSAIVRYLHGVTDDPNWREKLIADFSILEMGRDRYLQEYVAGLPRGIRERVDAFCQASYHAVGTTVVNCETGTDLSAMSNFKAESVVLANRDSAAHELSEEAVFLRAFMGYALNQIQCVLVPTHIIDTIRFEEVHQLSSALREQGFQAKYDQILQAAIEAAASSDAHESIERIDFGSLAEASREIAAAFQDYLDAELDRYRSREFDLTKEDAMQASADIGLDALAAIPGPGSIVSMAKSGLSAAKAVGLSARTFDLRDNEKAFAAAGERRRDEITAVIGSLQASGKKRAELLQAAAALADIYGIRTRRA